MQKTATITWIILLMLTIVSALISKIDSKYTALLILIFVGLKFFGITFQFMELKKAHSFWKSIVIGFFLIFFFLLLIIKN